MMNNNDLSKYRAQFFGFGQCWAIYSDRKNMPVCLLPLCDDPDSQSQREAAEQIALMCDEVQP